MELLLSCPRRLLLPGQVFDSCRQDWRPNGIRIPVEKKLGGRSTNSSLARSHTTTRVQLRGTPRRMFAEPRVGHILASANQSFRRGQASEFPAQSEGLVQKTRKPAKFFS